MVTGNISVVRNLLLIRKILVIRNILIVGNTSATGIATVRPEMLQLPWLLFSLFVLSFFCVFFFFAANHAPGAQAEAVQQCLADGLLQCPQYTVGEALQVAL